jgi:hypothetical protein
MHLRVNAIKPEQSQYAIGTLQSMPSRQGHNVSKWTGSHLIDGEIASHHAVVGKSKIDMNRQHSLRRA